MGYSGMGNGHVSGICDVCKKRSGSRKRKKLERKGWVFVSAPVTGIKRAYCPDCSSKMSIYEMLKGKKEKLGEKI